MRESIVVTNRGPVECHLTERGEVALGSGAGGLISGLLGALQNQPTTWVALAMTDGDRRLACLPQRQRRRLIQRVPFLARTDLRLLDVPHAQFRRHYDGMSNHILWFFHHYLLFQRNGVTMSKRALDDWQRGYRAVNDALADLVVSVAHEKGADVPIVFNDYHTYLAPRGVRARLPEARLSHLSYIPWPDPRYWEMLPEYMVRPIYAGLAACDLVGFQTRRDARNFTEAAGRFLDGAAAWWDECAARGTIQWEGRQVLIRPYPIALSAPYIQELAHSAAADASITSVESLPAYLAPRDGGKLILREDRLDPTKNIVAGFEAYESLLLSHPELRGRVRFLALLVPSRQQLAEYRAVERDVKRAVARINATFGTPEWQPILALYGNDRLRGLACLRYYDVLLINPLIDGMNLVAKEGGLVNQRDGVIVLSRTAGAYEQLGEHALGIAPTDIPGMAEALFRALSLPSRERHLRAAGARQVLLEEDGMAWLTHHLHDLLTYDLLAPTSSLRATR